MDESVGNGTRKVNRKNVTILASWGAEVRQNHGQQNHFFGAGVRAAARLL
jgi:hypothetical protein